MSDNPSTAASSTGPSPVSTPQPGPNEVGATAISQEAGAQPSAPLASTQPPGAPAVLPTAASPVWTWVLGAVATLALVAAVMTWQRLDRAQQELARQAAVLSQEAKAARQVAEESQNVAQALQARLAVAEVKLSEVSLQRTQLEELMLSLSRSRDDTLVQDIESGLKLAAQQAELTGSVQPLLSALLAAEQRIQKAAQPRLNPVQRALARDIERIRAASVTDVPVLVQRLDDLMRLADDLRLQNAPPRPKASAPVAAARKRSQPAVPAADSTTPTESPPGAHDAPAALWSGWVDRAGEWWAHLWAGVRQTLGDLVRVGRIDRPEAVLLTPDQAFFLRENLKLTVLNARLSLLSRHVASARTDLGVVRHMLATYFDPQDPVTTQALQALSDVLQSSKTVAMPRPDDTLTALAAAANGR